MSAKFFKRANYEDNFCIFRQEDFNELLPLLNGVKALQSEESTHNNDRSFDLQGRRLKQAPAKGVFIQNGKKVTY